MAREIDDVHLCEVISWVDIGADAAQRIEWLVWISREGRGMLSHQSERPEDRQEFNHLQYCRRLNCRSSSAIMSAIEIVEFDHLALWSFAVNIMLSRLFYLALKDAHAAASGPSRTLLTTQSRSFSQATEAIRKLVRQGNIEKGVSSTRGPLSQV